LKTRYFIKLSFKGTNYHGWQIQPNAITVQEVLNRDLSLLLGEKIEVTGCGRTDAGVHARIYYAHMDFSSRELSGDKDFLFRINNKLPGDIVIHEFIPARPGAHARFDAVTRNYEYHIHRTKDVFMPEYAHYVYGSLDFVAMLAASDMLREFTDFTSFSKADTDTITNKCQVHFARWDITDDKMLFTIQADRFLRNMVRAIVGTLLDVGFRRLGLDEFRSIIESKDRSNAGSSVPARGLFLTDVQYAPDVFIQNP
jgi:tRNA pseudouridine38-40 synthase